MPVYGISYLYIKVGCQLTADADGSRCQFFNLIIQVKEARIALDKTMANRIMIG